MNAYERIQKVLNRQQTDVVPVAPYLGNHAAVLFGCPLIDYYTQPAVMAEAQYFAWQTIGHDMVCMQSDNYYIAEGFGMQAQYHKNSTPTWLKPAITSLDNVARLRVPDPYQDGRMNVYIEATRAISHRLKGKVAIRSAGTGPFSLAGHLLGVEPFLMAIADIEHDTDEQNGPALHALMNLTTEALIAFSKAQLLAGADVVQCGDSLASLDMVSPEIYRKYAFPYEKMFFDAIRPFAREHHAYSLLHICGDNAKVMDLQAQTGADILEIDSKADLKTWKNEVGDRAILMGNLDPTRILLQASTAQVREASQACLDDAAAGGGYILGSGCEVPMYAPAANLQAMVASARAYQDESL